MMILKLKPNGVTSLPLTAYYGITLVNLDVGKSGISSCVLNIMNRDIELSTGNYPDKTKLTVNGDPGNTPSFILAPEEECKITLKLTGEFAGRETNEDIFLHYYLSYSVLKAKQHTSDL